MKDEILNSQNENMRLAIKQDLDIHEITPLDQNDQVLWMPEIKEDLSDEEILEKFVFKAKS